MALENTSIVTISIDESYCSVFSNTQIPQTELGSALWLSEQQASLNFRYRSSPSGYESDWHVAGDPTLIIVCGGCLEIELRDGSQKRFSVGDKFIARDFSPSNATFDPLNHGHRARVIGEEEFSAVHIKLGKAPSSLREINLS